jgi:hypothetical protein
MRIRAQKAGTIASCGHIANSHDGVTICGSAARPPAAETPPAMDWINGKIAAKAKSAASRPTT